MTSAAGHQPARVLIVEDNPTFRHALAEILQAQFPEMVIAQAGTGMEAIEKIHDFNPDLVFMDVRLPGENGLEVTRKIKLERPDITVECPGAVSVTA